MYSQNIVRLQETVRQEALTALKKLTGIENKGDLLGLMDRMGITSSYSSKKDEVRLVLVLRAFHYNDTDIIDLIGG